MRSPELAVTYQAAPAIPSWRLRLGALLGNASAFEVVCVILGGMPFYLPLFIALGEHALGSNTPVAWYFWANAVVSSPHVYFTYVRLHRKIKEKKVSFWWGWPCYLFWFGVLVVCTQTKLFLWAATLINVWQSFHYVRQTYGVGRFVARDAAETEQDRQFTWLAYHMAIPLFVFGRWDMLFTAWKGKPSTAIIPVHMPELLMQACWILALAGIGLGIAGEVIRMTRKDSQYSVLPALNLAVYYLVHYFGFLSIKFYQVGFFTVTAFHAFQYLALGWMLEDKKKSDETLVGRFLEKVPNKLSFLAFWLVLFVTAYTWENGIAGNTNYLWAQMSACLLLAVSAHHYTVDTQIWRKTSGL